MDSNIIKLKEPIKFGDETILELKFRDKLKAGDLKGVDFKDSVGSVLIVASRLTDNPPSVLDELNMEDLKEVSDKVNSFLPTSLTSGKK